MQSRIEPNQTAILERNQEHKHKIAVLVRHLLVLTTKLRTASPGIDKRSLLAEINLVESALRKVSRKEKRKGTSARTTRRSTLGRHETY